MMLRTAADLARRARAAFRAGAGPAPQRPAEADGMLHLGQVPLRQTVELIAIGLPDEAAEPLLERGILPGCRICPVRRAPSGDPILQVEGSLIALRRETAACLWVRPVQEGK